MSETWSEPDVPGTVHELDAETLLRTLREHDVEFVLVGGLAVAAHGYVRATKDVDIVPQPEAGNRRRLFEALRSLAAEPIEVGDLRAEELPVPFDPSGLDEGATGRSAHAPAASTSCSGSRGSRATRRFGRGRSRWNCRTSARCSWQATRIWWR